MKLNDPLQAPKEEFKDIIDKISKDSSLGIDAQLTHAVIINYLQQITSRLDNIEQQMGK